MSRTRLLAARDAKGSFGINGVPKAIIAFQQAYEHVLLEATKLSWAAEALDLDLGEILANDQATREVLRNLLCNLIEHALIGSDFVMR